LSIKNINLILIFNHHSTIINQQSSLMSIVRLKIDVSGTVADEAWREIKQFDQIQSADFGPQFGSGGRCNHAPDAPHAKGEWIGAEIRLLTPLLAQYAISHYLEQERVLDADVID
jgi:hypothetical protein